MHVFGTFPANYREFEDAVASLDREIRTQTEKREPSNIWQLQKRAEVRGTHTQMTRETTMDTNEEKKTSNLQFWA